MTEMTRRFFPQRILKPTSPTVPQAIRDTAPTAIGFIPVYETAAEVREKHPGSDVSVFNEVSNDARAVATAR